MTQNTAKQKFKYELNELYGIAQDLVCKIKGLEQTDARVNFFVGDLIEVTKELTTNNCKGFIKSNGADELTVEDLYSIATGEALWKAIRDFDISQGVYFLTYWKVVIDGHFKNEFARVTTNKMKFYQHKVTSSDKPVGDGDTTLMDCIEETTADFSDELVKNMVLHDLIRKFESVDKHGKVVRCEMIGKQELKTQAILQVLGAEVYGSKERKQVQRAKKRFAQFLIEQGFEY
jgi:hypothetical protein